MQGYATILKSIGQVKKLERMMSRASPEHHVVPSRFRLLYIQYGQPRPALGYQSDMIAFLCAGRHGTPLWSIWLTRSKFARQIFPGYKLKGTNSGLWQKRFADYGRSR